MARAQSVNEAYSPAAATPEIMRQARIKPEVEPRGDMLFIPSDQAEGRTLTGAGCHLWIMVSLSYR